MSEKRTILVGKAKGKDIVLYPTMANRHGLIVGATGTGKTVTLKVLAEGLSQMGVPVFLADIKGDISGICKKGEDNEHITKRVQELGLNDFKYTGYPTHFFDIFAKGGHPVRATISQMGPMLLSRLMNLSDVQEGVLNIVFRIADDRGLLLIDMKDLRSMLQYVGEHNNDYTEQYGNISTQSIGAIQRAMLMLEDNGGDVFFGEPELDFQDWISQDEQGRGIINVLHCVELYQTPLLYSTFLLWLLSELFENLPEVGDVSLPKLIFFFDEAHLLFQDAPKALKQKIEQVVKLIRSKGVGVYFVTQNPTDIPDEVLAQLGNRIQHALRAYTPAEMKSVKAAAQSFRENPEFKTEEVITDLKTGEALVSLLDEEGRPAIVERVMICPPESYMGAIDADRRLATIQSSTLFGKYEKTIDRQSAYEMLQDVKEEEAIQEHQEAVAKETEKAQHKTSNKRSVVERATTNAMSTLTRETSKSVINSLTGHKSRSTKNPFEKAMTSALSTLSGEVGRTISRGLFGIIKK